MLLYDEIFPRQAMRASKFEETQIRFYVREFCTKNTKNLKSLLTYVKNSAINIIY